MSEKEELRAWLDTQTTSYTDEELTGLLTLAALVRSLNARMDSAESTISGFSYDEQIDWLKARVTDIELKLAPKAEPEIEPEKPHSKPKTKTAD